MPSAPPTLRRSLLVRGEAAAKIRCLPLATELRDDHDGGPEIDPELVERARLEGFQSGYTDGHAAGLELAEKAAAAGEAQRFARVSQACAALTAAAEHLRRQQALELGAVEEALTAAAFELAEAVLGAELRLRSGGGAEAVARAMALVPSSGEVVLHLNPADAAALDEAGLADAVGARAHRVLPDPSVTPGGCRAVVGACEVDAQLPSALERVRRELLGREGA